MQQIWGAFMLHIISLRAQISLNVKYWYETCDVLVPILHSVKFAKCEMCSSTKPSSKIFYCPFQGSISFVNLICFFLSCVWYAFVRVCLYVPCGHLLGKGRPLGSLVWYLTVSLFFPIGIQDQVWYLILSIPDLCTLAYFVLSSNFVCMAKLVSSLIINHQ